MSEQKKRHRWEPMLSPGDSVAQCCECDLLRVRRPGVVVVYRYPSGKSVVAPERVPPCQPPSNKKTDTGDRK